jgi:cell division septal protein FtsQ
MRQSAKRTKTRLRAKPFLVLAIVLNLYLGLTRSPLTCLRHIRIEGAREFDKPRIEADLQSIQGIASLQVNPRELESSVLELPEVRNASLSRNIFGSGLLRVAYRTPVARFSGSHRLALSNEGVIYAANELDPGLTTLDAPKTATAPNLTLVGFWEPQRIALIAQEAKNIGVNEHEHILITESGRVILYIGQGRVVLGNCEGLEQKFRALRDRLARNPQELSQIAELDLTLPERPTVRGKTRGSAP